MRKPLIICIVLAATGALTAGLALAATPAPRTVKVGGDEGDYWFYKTSPKVPKLTVKRNTRVRFKSVSGYHDVWGYPSSTKEISSGLFQGEYSKYTKMTKTGTFTIFCDIHGKNVQSMKIKVVNP